MEGSLSPPSHPSHPLLPPPEGGSSHLSNLLAPKEGHNRSGGPLAAKVKAMLEGPSMFPFAMGSYVFPHVVDLKLLGPTSNEGGGRAAPRSVRTSSICPKGSCGSCYKGSLPPPRAPKGAGSIDPLGRFAPGGVPFEASCRLSGLYLRCRSTCFVIHFVIISVRA